MNERAVYYARVSTEEERQINALEKQCLDLEDCIKNNNWSLIGAYVDEGKSGSTIRKRDDYNRLFDDMSKDNFDIIVVKSLDRLNRNELDWYLFLNELTINQKKLFIYMDNCFYKRQDSMLVGIKSILNAEYSRELSRKLNNAHKRRQKEGSSVMTNGKLLGYDQLNGELYINGKEAKIVKRIYEMYVNESRGIREIINLLEIEGYSTNEGKKFGQTTINRILQNEKYMGTMICNKQHKDFYTKKVINNPKDEWIIHENRLPIIIDKELFEKAQKIRENRRQVFSPEGCRKGKRETRHLLGGKVICGYCGEVMWYNAIKKTYKEKEQGYRYAWMCSTFSRYGRIGNGKFPNEGCNKKNINDHYLTEELNILCGKINSTESRNELFDKLLFNIEDLLNNKSTNYGVIESISSEIIAIENKQILLVDKYLDGVISESVYTKKNDELEKDLIDKKIKLKELQVQANEMGDRNKVLNEYREIILELYEGLVSYEKMCSIISKIIAYNDKVEIYLFNMDNISIVLNKSLEFITNSFKATQYKDLRVKIK